MYSFKPEKCGSNVRLSGVLRSLLVLLPGLLAVAPVQAQVYNWKSVVIKGGGFVTGIVTHPNAPGLIYARPDIGGAYRWNATSNSWLNLS